MRINEKIKGNKGIMTQEEQLRHNTEKAYREALRAMFDLVNAITEERNYYRDLVHKKEASDIMSMERKGE